MSKALAPTIPYLVFQRSPGLSPGAVPTYSLPLGTTMMFDLRSTANSSVRAKMIEPSLGLIVIPVQAQTSDGQATTCERTTRVTRALRRRLIAGTPGLVDDSLALISMLTA